MWLAAYGRMCSIIFLWWKLAMYPEVQHHTSFLHHKGARAILFSYSTS